MRRFKKVPIEDSPYEPSSTGISDEEIDFEGQSYIDDLHLSYSEDGTIIFGEWCKTLKWKQKN